MLIDINEENLEVLRIIRNECRDFMTRSNAYVNREGQITWFDSIDKNEIKPYLFKQDDNIVGYGLIRNNNEFLLSGGLLEEYRDKGLGKILFNLLIEKCEKIDSNKTIALEVLKDNIRAISLYRKLGFYETERDAKVIFMKKGKIND